MFFTGYSRKTWKQELVEKTLRKLALPETISVRIRVYVQVFRVGDLFPGGIFFMSLISVKKVGRILPMISSISLTQPFYVAT